MRGDLGVGLEDGEVVLGASVSGRGVFGGGGRLAGHHGLDEDHLRLLDHGLDHLHRGAEAPGLQSRRIISRLQRQNERALKHRTFELVVHCLIMLCHFIIHINKHHPVPQNQRFCLKQIQQMLFYDHPSC